jgi:gamma-glutamyltranspeptidase
MAIYDRLPEETSKAYEAFCVYRDMGVQRSIQKAADMLSKSIPVLKRWAAQWDWAERVAAWDIDQDYLLQKEAIKSRQKEYRKELAEFRKNHLAVGKAAFKASATCVKQIMEFVEQNQAIMTLDDASKAANIVRSLMPVADLWAKALAVDKLLERLQNEDG